MHHSASFEVVIALRFDGSQPTTKQLYLPIAPFNTGSWSFNYQTKRDQSDEDVYYSKLTVSCVGVTSFAQVESVKLTDPDGDTEQKSDFDNNIFPPGPDWEMCARFEEPYTTKAYASLTVSFRHSVAPTAPPVTFEQLANRSAASLISQSPNDVVFFFPRTKRELWANSIALAAACAHFATMFESGFNETSTDARQSEAVNDSPGDDSDDSDTETDSVALERIGVRVSSAIADGVREVVIKDAAYTTYRAVLTWINSGYINFAPLTPQLGNSFSRKDALRARKTNSELGTSSTLPLPASPKSVYKLAHYLEITQLQEAALDNIKTQLTPGNVLYQLTTDIIIHDEVREALASFASMNWAAVRETAAVKWFEQLGVLDRSQHPLCAAVAIVASAAKSMSM